MTTTCYLHWTWKGRGGCGLLQQVRGMIEGPGTRGRRGTYRGVGCRVVSFTTQHFYFRGLGGDNSGRHRRGCGPSCSGLHPCFGGRVIDVQFIRSMFLGRRVSHTFTTRTRTRRGFASIVEWVVRGAFPGLGIVYKKLLYQRNHQGLDHHVHHHFRTIHFSLQILEHRGRTMSHRGEKGCCTGHQRRGLGRSTTIPFCRRSGRGRPAHGDSGASNSHRYKTSSYTSWGV